MNLRKVVLNGVEVFVVAVGAMFQMVCVAAVRLQVRPRPTAATHPAASTTTGHAVGIAAFDLRNQAALVPPSEVIMALWP